MRTVAEHTLEVYKSLGLSEGEAWDMMHQIAQKHGYTSYLDVPPVITTSDDDYLYLADEIYNKLVLYKRKMKYSFAVLAKEIKKLTGTKISAITISSFFKKTNVKSVNCKKHHLLRKDVYFTLKKFLTLKGYKLAKKDLALSDIQGE